MSIIKLMYSIVKIDWLDHYSLGEEWYDPSLAPGRRVISSVGFLAGQDDEYYYVCALIDNENETCSQGVAILKNCALSIQELKAKNDHKKRT